MAGANGQPDRDSTPDYAVIDACAFHEWPAATSLLGYLPEGWRTMVLAEGERSAPLDLKSVWRYVHPLGGKAEASQQARGPPTAPANSPHAAAPEGESSQPAAGKEPAVGPSNAFQKRVSSCHSTDEAESRWRITEASSGVTLSRSASGVFTS